MNKYGARRCSEDNIWFDSLAEREHYRELKLRALAGEITDLEVHPRYDLIVCNRKVGRMTLDFAYTLVATGEPVCVDVKGGRATRTEAYRLRRKVFEAIYGLTVTEVG